MKNNLSFLLILLFLFSNNFSIAKDKKHPKINEGFMYNTYPCCEGKEHFRKIKSKNHPFWNGVPIPKTLNKRKIPSISFTDSFNYNNINELDANYFEAYNNRGVIKDEMGWYKEAIADYDKAIELSPNDAMYYSNRAVSKLSLGQALSALQDCEKAIKLDATYLSHKACHN